VLDPFAGLFTVPYCAIELGRKGIGIELNPQYFEWGLRYCKGMEEKKLAPTLFDYLRQVEQEQMVEAV
jgi:DNA modification methylase